MIKTTFTLILLYCLSSATFAADPVETAIDIRVDTHQDSASTQARIDELANDTHDMVQEYKQIKIQLDDLRVYDYQLERLVVKQREELASFGRQLQNARETQHKIVPLMLRMVEVMEKFIQLDSPFLLKERTTRLTQLTQSMDDPETSLPEKYRRILEAYQIEADYGRTIEAYNDDIEMAGEKRTVDILRIGRTSLLYATLDGQETGRWDKKQRKWITLSKEYNQSITQGLRIARKQAPPDLIKLPIMAAGGAE